MKGVKSNNNPTEGKSFAEMRRIGNNQQTIIRQQQEEINQQHQDLEQRAIAIESQRREVETNRMQFHAESKVMTRKTLDQAIYFAYMSIPWYQFWKRWSISFMIQRSGEWHKAIESEVDRLYELNKPAGTQISASEAETIIKADPEQGATLTAQVPMGLANDDGVSYPENNDDQQDEEAIEQQ